MPDGLLFARICAELVGVDLNACDRETFHKITHEALPLVCLGRPHPWKRPGEIEKEIDGIVGDVRRLRRRIQSLDGYAMGIARREANRPERELAMQGIVDAVGDEEKMRLAVEKLTACEKPQDQWVDFAALRHLDALEASLIAPAERAIARAGEGTGRPKNLDAYEVAFAAARAFQNITGTRPTYWNGGSTPFSRMLKRLYTEIGIEAHTRKPFEWAMSKLPPLE